MKRVDLRYIERTLVVMWIAWVSRTLTKLQIDVAELKHDTCRVSLGAPSIFHPPMSLYYASPFVSWPELPGAKKGPNHENDTR